MASQTAVQCVAATSRRIGLFVVSLLSGITAPISAQQGDYVTGDVSDGGAIVGQVTFTGTASTPRRLAITIDTVVCAREPQFAEDLLVGGGGGLQNVVVWISDIREGKAWEPRHSPAALAQNGCRFVPHVLIVPVGEQFEVWNNDGILHNVHTRGTENRPVNKAQPGFLRSVRIRLAHAEIVHVECDAHNWMSGWIAVAAHPYYVITDQDGNYRLDDVPPGTYTLQFWHERLGTETQQVTVTAGGEAQVQARFASR